MTIINDLSSRVWTLDSVAAVDEMLSNLLLCMPSLVVLTPDGGLWEVFADPEDESLVLRKLDGCCGDHLEFRSVKNTFRLLAGGWVIARR